MLVTTHFRATTVVGLIVVAAAAGALAVAAASGARPHGAVVASAEVLPAHDYRGYLRDYDEVVDGLERRAAADPRSWTTFGSLAEAYLRRAGFAGSALDYQRADDALARAFALVPPGAGPFLTRARLSSSLHRLDRIAADLDAAGRAVLLADRDRCAIAVARGDLAFYGGDYATARADYERALGERRGAGALFALAQCLACTGRADAAQPLLAEALAGDDARDPTVRAWLLTERGMLAVEEERRADAARDYAAAAQAVPGWWFVDTRIAALRARSGDIAGARALYADLVARAGRGEDIDALAALDRAAGEDAAADELIAQADAIYAAMLASAPEAAYAHALEHALRFDVDPARALDLAERNERLRPYGVASIDLARAYLKAGDAPRARAVLQRVAASGWATPRLARVSAEVDAAAGAAR